MLYELYSTLRIMATRRDERAAVLAPVGTPRKSSARDNAALLYARAPVVRDEDARELAEYLSDKIDEWINQLYSHVRQDEALAVFDDAEEGEMEKKRKAKQASFMSEANECALDWF